MYSSLSTLCRIVNHTKKEILYVVSEKKVNPQTILAETKLAAVSSWDPAYDQISQEVAEVGLRSEILKQRIYANQKSSLNFIRFPGYKVLGTRGY